MSPSDPILRALPIVVLAAGLNGAESAAPAPPPGWEADYGAVLTALQGVDDGATPVELSFAFPYDGRLFNTLHVGANGVIGLGERGAAGGYPLDDEFQTTSAPVLAPFWTDMDLRVRGAVRVRDLGNRVVVTWDGIGSAARPDLAFTFQAQLGADGTVDFAYHGIPPLGEYSVDSVVHVGLSAGSLASPPVPVDLADDAPLAVGPTVLQRFWTPDRFPIDGARLRFEPRPGEGYLATVEGPAIVRRRPTAWDAATGSAVPELDGQDDTSVAVDLAFGFPYDGRLFNRIHIGANGAIALGEPGSIETVPSNAVFAGTTAPILAPFWTDLSLGLMGEVFLRNDVDRAVVTWRRVGTYRNPGVPFTFQAQIFPDGRVVYAWYGISPLKPETVDTAVFVGITAGGRTTPPSPVAFEDQAVLVHDNTVHHRFSIGDPFPLDGESVEFAPRGPSVYRVAYSGRAADPVPVPPIWEADPGAELESLAGTDDAATAVALGFGFPRGGRSHDVVWVGSNGVLGLGSEGSSGTYGTESGFRQTTAPLITPFWTDLNLEAIGSVHARLESTRAVFTWAGVATYADQGVPVTFQVMLHADGRIVFGYGGVPAFTSGNLGGDVFVGMTPGALAALPAEVHYLADAPFDTGDVALQRFNVTRPFLMDGHNIVFTPTGPLTYAVTVREPGGEEIRIGPIGILPTSFRLRWNTLPGVVYRVEAKSGWTDDWETAGTITADGAEATFDLPRTGDALRLLRIRR